MKKVERLSVAAAVAPVLRGQAEAVKKRRVKVYVQETGEVVGEITLAEAQAGILATARIEFDTAEGVKETHRECAGCGKPFALEGHGNRIKTCDGCRTRQTKCAGDGCDAVPPGNAFIPSLVAKRKGKPWTCRACQRAAPEWRAKLAERTRRKYEDPEFRAKRAEAVRRLAETPEWRAKQAEGMRRRSENPEWRAKVLDAGRRRKNENPEWYANVAEGNRRKAQDPEWRAKNEENLRRAREAKRAKNEERTGAAPAEGGRE